MTSVQPQSETVLKANFTNLYNNEDPGAYFTSLMPLEYTIPQQVQPLFQRFYQQSCRGRTPSAILDVCCSYGINGGLLQHDVDMDTWAAQYVGSELDSKQQVLADKEFFASRARSERPVVLGLDKAHRAVRYAVDAGLIEAGWAEDLEVHDPSLSLRTALGDVSFIICTGGVSYVGPRTFARIMAAVGTPSSLWVASTVIRTVSYEAIGAVLNEHGLVTEKLPGIVLRQRRFASAQEQSDAIKQVVARGLDPAGLEDEGYLCADVYISRPVAGISSLPLAELVKVLNGAQVKEANVYK